MKQRPSHAALPLLVQTATASSDVIARRLCAFSDPWAWASPGSQREASRMVQEKWDAGGEGAMAAWQALARMPLLVLQSGVWLAPWQPQAWWRWWSTSTEAWIGLGNAALRPAQRRAVANRRRLRAR